ncbi:hypothetical protein ACPF8X_35840 [Streptomyces sp. G35A]
MKHTTRAILALTAAAATLALAAPAQAADRPSDEAGDAALATAESMPKTPGIDSIEKLARLVSESGQQEDRGILGMALDLLTGTPPEVA